MFQILSGVNYLHLQNSAHNDIKTSNVLLFEDGSVKLTDLGSVGEHYEGYGTPLYAAPELCKHFYGLLQGNSSDDEKNSGMKEGDLDGERGNVAGRGQGPRNQRLFGIDAKKCDMWCCGLVLYKLLTGKDGPLPVHQKNYSGRYKDPNSDLDDNGVTPLSPINCFQLYYEIASQEKPVCLDDLPDLIIETVGAARVPVNGFAGKYPPNSVRNLLEGLLAIEPDKRLTSQEALAHPWITSLLEIIQASSGLRRPPNSHEHGGQRGSAWRSVEEAIRRGIAHEVLQSRQVRKILKRDNESHLQFVADCCNILNVNIPDEVFKPFGTEPYENNYYSGMWGRGVSVPRPQSSSAVPTAADGEGQVREAVMGTLVRPNLPRVMPRGCVDPHLFLPFDEANYYERKSGKKGFDVRCLLGQTSKVARLEEYLHNVVLVKCGYREGPDPAFEAAARGALGFLPRLRYHLGSLGSEVGCLYSTPSQSIAPTMVFRSGQPRGSPSGEASSRSLLLPHAHEDSKHGGARGSTSTTALRPQPTQGREGERQHIAAGIVMTSGPPGNTGRRGGGDAGTQRGAANEARQIINRQRVTSGVYQGSEREGIEAAAESSKCFCGLG
ncbi:unnamed protein product [Phytomonas sp. EM1]|nr:unnamed protein product [Phytomonas sp. EM1]|eukprot:CCW64004.1 unnamed protein product [Phytomonas sp. isolate EM1]